MITVLLASMITTDFETLQTFQSLAFVEPGAEMNLIIESPGGSVDIAVELAKELNQRKVNCYVTYAASAALQIIMPTCKTIYAIHDARLQWHSTHFYSGVPFPPLPFFKFQEIASDLYSWNTRMVGFLNDKFNKKDGIKCDKKLMVTWSKWTSDCAIQYMLNETVMGPHEWNYQWGLTGENKIKPTTLSSFPKPSFQTSMTPGTSNWNNKRYQTVLNGLKGQ